MRWFHARASVDVDPGGIDMNQRTASSTFRALTFAAMAGVTGILALAAIHATVQGYERALLDARRTEDKVLVVVAARDLHQGVPVEESDLYAVQMPHRYVPDGVFLSPDALVGRIPKERILANELVRGARLAQPESGDGLNAVIPRGLRGISVDVTDGAAVSGHIGPASYVDVLVTIDREGGATARTETVLQSLYVLGVNGRTTSVEEARRSGRRGPVRSSVTLLVTPQQAEQLAYAENQGRLVLSLRNPEDVDPVVTYGADIDSLLGAMEVAPAPSPVLAHDPCRDLQITHGGSTVYQPVDRDGFVCE